MGRSCKSGNPFRSQLRSIHDLDWNPRREGSCRVVDTPSPAGLAMSLTGRATLTPKERGFSILASLSMCNTMEKARLTILTGARIFVLRNSVVQVLQSSMTRRQSFHGNPNQRSMKSPKPYKHTQPQNKQTLNPTSHPTQTQNALTALWSFYPNSSTQHKTTTP